MEIQAASQKMCGTAQKLGRQVQWVQGYLADDKVHRVFIAPSAEMIRGHARMSGFPANRISEIRSVIDPTRAEG
jgi:Nickel responsive protein SCO4226-like